MQTSLPQADLTVSSWDLSYCIWADLQKLTHDDPPPPALSPIYYPLPNKIWEEAFLPLHPSKEVSHHHRLWLHDTHATCFTCSSAGPPQAEGE